MKAVKKSVVAKGVMMGGIYHCTFVQAQRMFNTKREPLDKLWALGDYDVSMYVHP